MGARSGDGARRGRRRHAPRLLKKLARRGDVFQVVRDLFYARASIGTLAKLAAEQARQQNGAIGAAAFAMPLHSAANARFRFWNSSTGLGTLVFTATCTCCVPIAAGTSPSDHSRRMPGRPPARVDPDAMEHFYFKLLHLLSAPRVDTRSRAASFLESVAFIGMFVPDSTAMFVAGMLVGTGALNIGWVFVCAIAGAAASFWFGQRYADSIARMWPFRQHPGAQAANTSTCTGRKAWCSRVSSHPMCAVVPVVAGLSGMTPARFLVVNILSALI